MKQKMREVLPSKEEHNPAKPDQRKGHRYSKPNRKKKQEKLIAMHPGFTFYFDSRGVCCYRKKRVG